MAGLYFHIPFCRKACSYCDFHFSTHLASKPRLVQAMAQELRSRKDYLKVKILSSLYFGGGTPSLLSGEELGLLMLTARDNFVIDRAAEVTLETNPDDINEKSLELWLNAGINRLSIGLQSFDDRELQWMNRAHTAADSFSAVRLARAAGFNSLSIDLIYGSRFQTLETWKRTLEMVIGMDIQHVSAYNLTIESKTRLGIESKRGKEPAVDETLSAAQFELMQEMLQNAGFEHYEISNFAKRGHRAQHNSSYWLQEPYLGIGPSAHSFNGAGRQWNVKSNAAYMQAIESGGTYFEMEELSPKSRFNEMVMTGLRTSWGCDPALIGTMIGGEFKKHFLSVAEKKMNLFDVSAEGVYVLKPSSRLLADGIASDFFLV